MKELALSITPHKDDFANHMFTLGYLHNIGYEFTNDQEEHAQVGGLYLKNNCYKYWREVFYHGRDNNEYNSGPLIILNTADLHINLKGEEVTAQKRLAEVAALHGEESTRYKRLEELARNISKIAIWNFFNSTSVSMQTTKILKSVNYSMPKGRVRLHRLWMNSYA